MGCGSQAEPAWFRKSRTVSLKRKSSVPECFVAQFSGAARPIMKQQTADFLPCAFLSRPSCGSSESGSLPEQALMCSGGTKRELVSAGGTLIANGIAVSQSQFVEGNLPVISLFLPVLNAGKPRGWNRVLQLSAAQLRAYADLGIQMNRVFKTSPC